MRGVSFGIYSGKFFIPQRLVKIGIACRGEEVDAAGEAEGVVTSDQTQEVSRALLSPPNNFWPPSIQCRFNDGLCSHTYVLNIC